MDTLRHTKHTSGENGQHLLQFLLPGQIVLCRHKMLFVHFVVIASLPPCQLKGTILACDLHESNSVYGRQLLQELEGVAGAVESF